MGIKITTDDRPVKVHRNDKGSKPSYYLTFGKKEGDNWVNVYQPIRFRQGVEVHDGQEICIQHAFPIVDSWVKDNQQLTRIVWMIMEFEGPRSKQTADNYDTAEAELPDSFNAVDEDVPF